uniref:t-SNARE coiled-coil homology domain-containing protein n=1 Tax=Compsopogon caeruleus TaxID=31354 RepID=A0A7S1XDW1_9RHOD|mmetsp:Transcript_15899/g.31877  ORF Transcript_15899/g.31877 Transcript_15899/m.31877 type:complete len:301 (+) Transcript_15899:133-1035(+)
MKDRLAELRGDEYDEEAAMGGDALEHGRQGMSEGFEKFARELAIIEKAVGKVEGACKEIETEFSSGKALNEEGGVREEIQSRMDDCDQKCAAVRKRLKRIAEENKVFAAAQVDKVAEARVRVNRHQAVTKRFMDATQKLEKVQDSQKDAVYKMIERQIRSVNPDATEGEIRAAMETGNLEQVFDGVELSARHREIKQRLGDIHSKNQDIQKLEKNIAELAKMFVDMTLLVETQGALLNELEFNTKKTVDVVEAAHEEIVQAREYQKSARKKMCWITLIILIIILIIVFVILWRTGVFGGN